jgi:hypothetical protein
MFFTLRKFFWDLWDNLIWGMGANFLALLPMGLLFAFQWAVLGVEPVIPGTTDFTETIIDPNAPFTSQDWLFFGLLALSILWFIFIAGAVHKFTVDISEGHKPEKKKIGQYLASGWWDLLKYGFVALGFNTMALFSMYWYAANMPPDIGTGLIAALILVMFFLNMVFANFLAYSNQKERGFWRTIKETVLFVVDNFWYSVFVLAFTAFLVFISVISALIVIGPFGIFLWFQVTMRLRLKKYDYLYGEGAAVKTGEKKKIPWETLWFQEKEMVDRRSWKNIFTPWRD